MKKEAAPTKEGGKIREMFSRIAPTYDRLNHWLSAGRDIAWRREAVRRLPQKERLQVLDLGAGTGDFALEVLRVRPSARVALVDFALPMLSRARRKLKSFGENAAFLCADAHRLPFADMTFDALVCGFAARNFEHLDAALKEAARVLRPGATAVFLEFFRPERIDQKIFYKLFLSRFVPWLGGLVSGDKEAYRYLPASTQAFDRVADFQNRLREAGFEKVQAQPLSFGIAHAVFSERG